MQQHDSDDAQPDLRLPDLRLHLAHCGAILMQRRLFIIGRRRAGADTRAAELALTRLELKVLNFEDYYRICLEREGRARPAAARHRAGTDASGNAAPAERAATARFFDKSEPKVPAAISPAALGQSEDGALSGI